MHFFIYTEDKADSLHIRKENRDAHLQWLNAENDFVSLLTAGPWLDNAAVMRGSMLIVEASDKTNVENWLALDPYRQAGLTASTMIKPYVWVIGSPS